MSLYMSPFKLDLPRTCPLQHYSAIAYKSDQVTGLRQLYGGVHVSHDVLCFWHLHLSRPCGRANNFFLFFATVFWGRQNTTLLFPDHSRGRVNKMLFIQPLQKKGKYNSSNDWLHGSFYWQREPINLRESQQRPRACPSVYNRIPLYMIFIIYEAKRPFQ